MSDRIEILRKREQLLARCESQRTALALAVERWEGPLAKIDRAVEGIVYLRKHPLILGILIAVTMVFQRRGLLGWAKRGFVLWRTYRTLRTSGVIS